MSEQDRNRELDEARWNKEWGPPLSRRRKLLSLLVFCLAFFGILAAVLMSASYD